MFILQVWHYVVCRMFCLFTFCDVSLTKSKKILYWWGKKKHSLSKKVIMAGSRNWSFTHTPTLHCKHGKFTTVKDRLGATCHFAETWLNVSFANNATLFEIKIQFWISFCAKMELSSPYGSFLKCLNLSFKIIYFILPATGLNYFTVGSRNTKTNTIDIC